MKSDKTILILDDEVICNMALESELNESGFLNIFTATNYEDGVTVFEREKPDVILIDINMGSEKNGFDFIKFVDRRSLIIIISGYDKSLYQDMLLEVEYLAYLEKPLNIDRLLKLLKN